MAIDWISYAVKAKFLVKTSESICNYFRLSSMYLQQVGTDNEAIAKLVFMELNNAWSDFENDATQQNIFSS